MSYFNKFLLLCLVIGIGGMISSFNTSKSTDNLVAKNLTDFATTPDIILDANSDIGLQSSHVNTDSNSNSNASQSSASDTSVLNQTTINQTTHNQADYQDYASQNLTAISLEQAKIDKVYVDKSEQRLYLMQGDTAIKSYHIALGDAPKGHKQREGDERTPEGEYTLDYKNENSIAYRSIHVSYPNAQDIAHAKSLGVSPGGAIMIHGQMNGAERFTETMQRLNWTDGCMAVTNNEMDEIMSAVKVGTPIEIVW